MIELLVSAAEAAPDRPAVVRGDERVTYSELLDKTERLAAGLAASGIGPGDPVAVLLPNTAAFVTSFFAIGGLGATVVPLNPRFKDAELEFYFRECGIRAVVATPRAVPSCVRIRERLGKTTPIVVAGGRHEGAVPFDDLLAESGGSLESRRDGDLLFQYSSGSTGRPKRVPRTASQLRAEADAFVSTTGLTTEDVVLCAIPLFHAYGLGCCLAASVRSRSTLVLASEPQPVTLTRGELLDVIDREHVSVFPAVPFTLRLLAETTGSSELSNVRLCFSAGVALPLTTFDAFVQRFGIPIRQVYGCTETGAATVNLEADPVATARSVGRPIENVEIRIVDDAGSALPPGHIGEIAISGPGMTRGYAGMDALNRHAFGSGAFLTGDRGRLDEENRLFITGRTKLLIEAGGDKVDPIEVEDVLAVHPRVQEVVVVGVPGATESEELIKAVVVPDGLCEERELIRFCRERLANYKVPHLVSFSDEIPRDAHGKILRKYLIENL